MADVVNSGDESRALVSKTSQKVRGLTLQLATLVEEREGLQQKLRDKTALALLESAKLKKDCASLEAEIVVLKSRKTADQSCACSDQPGDDDLVEPVSGKVMLQTQNGPLTSTATTKVARLILGPPASRDHVFSLSQETWVYSDGTNIIFVAGTISEVILGSDARFDENGLYRNLGGQKPSRSRKTCACRRKPG